MLHDILKLNWKDLKLISNEIEKMVDDDTILNLPKERENEELYFNTLKERILSEIENKKIIDFIEEYFFLYIPIDGRIVKTEFKLNERQKELYQVIKKEEKIVKYYKSRQEGVTTFLAAFATASALINKHKILFVCPYNQLREKIYEKIYVFLMDYKSKTGEMVLRNRRYTDYIDIFNGSRIFFRRGDDDIRGMNVDYVIADEMEFFDKNENELNYIEHNLYLCLTENGKLIEIF